MTTPCVSLASHAARHEAPLPASHGDWAQKRRLRQSRSDVHERSPMQHEDSMHGRQVELAGWKYMLATLQEGESEIPASASSTTAASPRGPTPPVDPTLGAPQEASAIGTQSPDWGGCAGSHEHPDPLDAATSPNQHPTAIARQARPFTREVCADTRRNGSQLTPPACSGPTSRQTWRVRRQLLRPQARPPSHSRTGTRAARDSLPKLCR
jgi:hypothetical protein